MNLVLRVSWLVILTALTFSTPASAPSFDDLPRSSPNGPTDVFAADLNHDSHPDIVTTQFSAGMVTVFLNHGNGTFTDGGSATYVTAPSPRVVTVADFNGDGHPDIATGSCPSEGQQNFASILFGNGDGTFKNHVDYAIPQCAFSIGTIRVGTDKLLSILMTDGTHIQLLRNNGAGVFTLHTITYPGSDLFLWASAGDYNRDGFQDIAFVEQNRPLNQNRLLIMNGKVDGTFALPRVIFATPATGGTALFMNVVNTVDVNGDGVGDLIASFNQNGTHGGVLVFVNQGNGAFNRSMLNLSAEQFENGKMAEGDFRGTGLHDIVLGTIRVANTGQDSVVIFPATSKTSWGAPREFPVGQTQGPHSIVRGDFNGDQQLDFAFATSLPDVLHVFLNTTQARACPPPSSAGVAVCSPASGSTATSTVRINASANGGSRNITAMKAYVDSKLIGSSSTNTLDVTVSEPAGSHSLTVNAWNAHGQLFQAKVNFNVD
jgi:hypothetical protein